MAGVDILLKLIGNAESAIRAMTDTTNAAKKTETQVEKTQRSIQTMLRGITVGTAISAIGSIESAFRTMADVVNGLTGGPGRERAASEALATAGGPTEFGAAIAAEARSRGLKATPGKIWENILPGRAAGETKVGRRVDELVKLLRDMSPEEAEMALQNVPGAFFEGAPTGYTRSAVAEKLRRTQEATAYRTGLRSGPTNITNIYPVGTNPASVDKAQSRYERINGRPRRP